MTDNILSFPQDKIVRHSPSFTEDMLSKMKEKGAQNFADMLVQEITTNILAELSGFGMDIEKDTFGKDFMFLTGVLSATIYRSMDLKHEFHQFIDESVDIIRMDDIPLDNDD